MAADLVQPSAFEENEVIESNAHNTGTTVCDALLHSDISHPLNVNDDQAEFGSLVVERGVQQEGNRDDKKHELFLDLHVIDLTATNSCSLVDQSDGSPQEDKSFEDTVTEEAEAEEGVNQGAEKYGCWKDGSIVPENGSRRKAIVLGWISDNYSWIRFSDLWRIPEAGMDDIMRTIESPLKIWKAVADNLIFFSGLGQIAEIYEICKKHMALVPSFGNHAAKISCSECGAEQPASKTGSRTPSYFYHLPLLPRFEMIVQNESLCTALYQYRKNTVNKPGWNLDYFDGRQFKRLCTMYGVNIILIMTYFWLSVPMASSPLRIVRRTNGQSQPSTSICIRVSGISVGTFFPSALFRDLENLVSFTPFYNH